MQLNEQEKRVLISELRKRTAGRRCGICGGRNFSVPEMLFELKEFQGGPESFGVAALAMLTCNQCGFVRLFNTKLIDEQVRESMFDGDISG